MSCGYDISGIEAEYVKSETCTECEEFSVTFIFVFIAAALFPLFYFRQFCRCRCLPSQKIYRFLCVF